MPKTKPARVSKSSISPTEKKLSPSRTDIFMSIKPEHIANIACRRKNHEYRNYLLPASIQRIWFYTSAPISSLHYVARISAGKPPGQVPEDGGLMNAEFNQGLLDAKYGYEILELWKLENPITLVQGKEDGWLKGPPQKYCWVSEAFLGKYPDERLELVFGTGESPLVEDE